MKAEQLRSATESERYLAGLCRRAFLSLWAHPNVYTDEGKPSGKGVGKELCDLLVVFGSDVIVFSDKHCRYKETGDDAVDWKRWYRKAIGKSVSQLRGAASFLERFPDRIFLDNACSEPFPVPIPPAGQRRFHLVAVTRGSLDACSAYFGNKSIGSLRFGSSIEADEVPFALGPIDSAWGLIHVFDEHSLDALFLELDTVADFVGYLRKRTQLLGAKGVDLYVDGEEQLLARYLTTLDAGGQHNFLATPLEAEPEVETLAYFEEGSWEALQSNAQYRAKKQADQVSYIWDRIISRFIDLGQDDLVDDIPGAWRGESEPAVRQMAYEGRFSRRILGSGIKSFLETAKPDKSLARVMVSHDDQTRAYVFLAEPFTDEFADYNQYRAHRARRLYVHCLVARLLARTANTVVGIGLDSPRGRQAGGSEDLIYTYEPELSEELFSHAKMVQDETGILLNENITRVEVHHFEFPEAVPERMTRQQRRAMERAEKKLATKRRS